MRSQGVAEHYCGEHQSCGECRQKQRLRLAELELIERERRMVERRIKEAKFPAVKSLDSFDFLALPSLNKVLVLELARSEYVARRENIIAVGNSESDSYCPPRYVIRMPSHFGADRQTTAAEHGVDPQRV